MSLFHRPIRPAAIWSDEAVERYLAAIREEISLDPLFRRRLRGTVVNRFVAEREGALAAGGRGGVRRMGIIGRSVLYASVALAVSVTGTMAASQGSIPGEALYPLKRQIEALRIEALPAHFHDELAAHALGERIEELGRLVERGDWARVAAHAAAVAHDSDEFLKLIELDPAAADRHLVVLSGLLDRLPARAQLAIANVVHDVESAAVDAGVAEPAGSIREPSKGHEGGPPGAQGGQGGPSEVKGPRATAAAEPTPRPTPRERPEATIDPEPTPQPTPKPQPAPRHTKSASPAPASTEAASEDSSD